MSQFPPQSPYDPPSQPFDPMGGAPRGNGMAVTSLVFGLVGFCVPVLGGLLAILFGIIGLNKAKNPNVTGKGMAIAGLLLGVLSSVSYVAGGYFFFTAFQGIIKEVVQGPDEFLSDLSKGDVNGALTRVDPSSVDRAKIEAAAEEVKPWGAFRTFTAEGQPQNIMVNNVSEMTITGKASFEKETKVFTISMKNSQAAPFSFKIYEWSFK